MKMNGILLLTAKLAFFEKSFDKNYFEKLPNSQYKQRTLSDCIDYLKRNIYTKLMISHRRQ